MCGFIITKLKKFIHKMAKLLDSPLGIEPTLSPLQGNLFLAAKPLTKGIKKTTTLLIAPPDTGEDAPKFIPSLPFPQAIELDNKEPTLWRSQLVGGLWTVDQNGTGWLWTAQENWVRLSDATESGLMAMLMLAASGKETGTPCLYRKGDDGKINELYIL
jgi:hypothetical protein